MGYAQIIIEVVHGMLALFSSFNRLLLSNQDKRPTLDRDNHMIAIKDERRSTILIDNVVNSVSADMN